MRKNKPSRTAYKVAMNILTLGAKPGMDRYFPPGVLEATAELLFASGVAGRRLVQWACSKRMVRDDTLTLALPLPLFKRMEEEAGDCILQTPAWKKIAAQ